MCINIIAHQFFCEIVISNNRRTSWYCLTLLFFRKMKHPNTAFLAIPDRHRCHGETGYSLRTGDHRLRHSWTGANLWPVSVQSWFVPAGTKSRIPEHTIIAPGGSKLVPVGTSKVCSVCLQVCLVLNDCFRSGLLSSVSTERSQKTL